MNVSSLQKYIPSGAAQINEEQLFIAITAYQLDMKKPGLGEVFIKAVDEAISKATSKNSSRTPQLEEIGTLILGQLKQQGILSGNEHEQILKTSWTAAQLDQNPELWDSRGSQNDPTIAVSETLQAISNVEKNLEQIKKGSLKLIDPSAITSGIDSKGMPNGFLWKPITENSGTAAVLFNSELAKQTAKVELVDANGKLIASGRFTSFGEDGARGKYQFPKEGGSYPSKALIVITLNNGEKITVPIKDPAKRLEQK